MPPPAGATFTMTQLAAANRIYQRTSATGGGQGKGQGTIPVTLNLTGAGTIYARCRSAADGTTIVQPPWQAVANAAVANGPVNIAGVDARLGWFYLDLSGDGATWINGTVAVGMGRLIGLAGQSLQKLMINMDLDATTLTAMGITPSANGRVLLSAENGLVVAANWSSYANTGSYNSAGGAELLNLQVAASGVNCGLIGNAVGSTAISSWLPGQPHHTELARVIALAGGAFESFFWFQGHSDAAGGTYQAYYDKLNTLFTALAGLSSRSFTKYLSAIPNIISGTWGNTAERSYIRNAQKNWCAANGAIYLGFADIELHTDGVHQVQAGARRIARHVHRAMRPEFGLSGDNRGPLVTGVTRSGLDLNLAINMPANASALTSVGSPATRFLVAKAGELAKTALALDGSTPITVGTTTISLKLAADPGNIPLEVWPMDAHPVVDGSASGIYDNASADGDGISIGRQLFASPSPARVKINTPLTSVSATYGAGKFGNGRTGGRLESPYPGLLGVEYNGQTIDFWVRVNSLPGGNRVLLGQNGAFYVGITPAGAFFTAIAGVSWNEVAGAFAAGNTYHIRVVLTPGHHTAYVFIDGVLRSNFSVASFNNASITSVFAIGDRGGSPGFTYTEGWIDEVAIFNTMLGTANFTPPVAEWTGSESNLLHLWHLNESSGNAADSAV